MLLQFAFFALAFCMKLVVQLVFILSDAVADWDTFVYVVMQVLSHYFVDIMPISYMTWCHH